MATPTPWQYTKRQLPTVQKKQVFARDLYNFTAFSVSQGTDNPVVPIPSSGPHAAGAIPPNQYPNIVTIEVIITGSGAPEFGANL